MNKKIVYISGTRADFNLMIRTLLELKKIYNLTIIATGMHLSSRWGNTIEEINNYNFDVKEADINLEDESILSMLEAFGKEIIDISRIIENIKPNLIMVEGDRGEALAGAIIGAHMNIPVIHHGGGDISGSIDNKIRKAITSFSDFHLTGNIKSYNNLINFGIPKEKVFNVGEPGLDDIFTKNYTTEEELRKKYEIPKGENIILLIFHPDTEEIDKLENQITVILETLKEFGLRTFALYANADAGGNIINELLNSYQKEIPNLRIYKHFHREDFLGLMNICSAMIGNSSSGLTELPSFHKPFIYLGSRQKGRLKANNVIKVDFEREAIIKALKKSLYDREFRKELKEIKNPYDNGKSYLRIRNIINKLLQD